MSPAWMSTSPFGRLTVQLCVSDMQTNLVLLVVDAIPVRASSFPAAVPKKMRVLDSGAGSMRFSAQTAPVLDCACVGWDGWQGWVRLLAEWLCFMSLDDAGHEKVAWGNRFFFF